MDLPGWMQRDATSVTMFEQFIMHKLLFCHPNNYSEALSRHARTLPPRHLRRAIDYMHANLTAPITIADIAEASCIAGRTLFQYFRDFRGTSPMRYLCEARFEKVRDILAHAPAGEGVAELAKWCGFSHLGRFAMNIVKCMQRCVAWTARPGAANLDPASLC